MERIAILDHNEHKLYIEDIPDEILDAWDGEEAYIKDNYDMETFSWDFITEALYLPCYPEYYDPIEIDFKQIVKE